MKCDFCDKVIEHGTRMVTAGVCTLLTETTVEGAYSPDTVRQFHEACWERILLYGGAKKGVSFPRKGVADARIV
jgi:hypothetical protein